MRLWRWMKKYRNSQAGVAATLSCFVGRDVEHSENQVITFSFSTENLYNRRQIIYLL